MFRPLTLFVTAALMAWLLPLGAFINASQQKTACGGKRAFHMCSMMSSSAPSPDDGTVKFTGAHPVEKTAKSSASGGDDFTAERLSDLFKVRRLWTEHSEIRSFSPISFEIPVPPPRLFA